MKVIGRRSIASILKSGIDGTWYLVAFTTGLLALLLVYSFFFELEGRRITMVLPVALEAGSDSRLNVRESVVFSPLPHIKIEEGLDTATLLNGQGQIENVRADLRFPIRERRFLSVNLTIILLIMLLFLWVLRQLRHVFRTLSDGQPFVKANVTRIRSIGFALIAGECIRAGVIFFWSSSTAGLFTANGMHFVPVADLNFSAIFSGFVILVIAEVFREGAALRQDQSLTI
jgi:hypothetical protein